MRAAALLMLAALCACASETPEEPAASSAQTPPGGSQAKRFELLEPTGEIEGAPSELRWRVGPGLTGCRAFIVTESAASVWTSPPSEEGIVQVPDSVQQQFEPGTLYLWKVVCPFSGLQLGSDYARFTLTRP